MTKLILLIIKFDYLYNIYIFVCYRQFQLHRPKNKKNIKKLKLKWQKKLKLV